MVFEIEDPIFLVLKTRDLVCGQNQVEVQSTSNEFCKDLAKRLI